MLPTFVGFGLFVLWALPIGRKLRSSRPMANLYLSAIVAMLVFSEAVCEPLYLLGFIEAEGDPIGYVTKAGGPVWLVKILLGGIFLISAIVLWRVLPEVVKSWKAQFLQPSSGVSRAPAAWLRVRKYLLERASAVARHSASAIATEAGNGACPNRT